MSTDIQNEHEFLTQAGHEVFRDLSNHPGAAIEVDPDVAEHLGAFKEDALTPEEAEASGFDEEVYDE